MPRATCRHGNPYGYCGFCDDAERRRREKYRPSNRSRGTFQSTGFRDAPQRDDPTVTNVYFNAGEADGSDHGHVKLRDNPDNTTDYLYVRDVEGNEYDI